MTFTPGIDTVDDVQTIRDNIMAKLTLLYVTTEKTVEGNSTRKQAIVDLEKLKVACDTFLLTESVGQADTSVTVPYFVR